MFDQLKLAVPDKENLIEVDVHALTSEQKIELCWTWKLKGVSITTLAKSFSVSRRTIYQWLAKGKEYFISNMEEMTYLELIADHDMQLEHLENVALAELDRITEPEFGADENGNIYQKKKAATKEISELLRTIASIRDQRMKLHQHCGLIPKVPDRLHHVISSKDSVSLEEYEQTDEELRVSLMSKLNRISRL
jgi:predicted DNA-binding protein YlxM (UPF0122 family)